MTPRLLLAAVACLTLLAPGARAASPASGAVADLVAALEQGAPEEIKTLAIWQFLDDKLTDPLRRAFRDDLEIALIQCPRFQYFHRQRFRQILRERQLTLAKLLDPAAMKAAAAAGIHAFLSVEIVDAACAHPELKDIDTHCVALAKLTDARTAAIAWAGYIEGVNQPALRTLLAATSPRDGTTRYRQIATAIARSLAASGLADAGVKTITLSSPPKDADPDTGIGIRNPDHAPFDLKTFQDELLLAIARTKPIAYVDPTHIARLIAQWNADSDTVADTNKKALAEAFALDGYLFGEIRRADDASLELSTRLVSLKDGSEAWAGKFAATDDLLRLQPREVPQPPVPREEPPEPAELTLEDIERPLKPPVPQPKPLPLPDGPSPRRRLNPIAALLYLPLGLPRDALDTAFVVADRVPLAGGLTSAVYRYGGIAHLTRAGTAPRFRRDALSGEALTYGQLRSRDEYPTRFPLIHSARTRYNSRANYLLQLSLGTLTAFDLLDTATSTIDRTPVAGTLTTPLLLPLSYAWRHVPDDGDLYVPQVAPARPENRLTYGSLATEHPWSLLPNARSWPTTFATPRERATAERAFAQQHQAIVQHNAKQLADWHAAEQARTRDNDQALATLRQRNATQRRTWEQGVARVRRENQLAQQRYQRDKQAADDHNTKAARINLIAASVFDLRKALAPPKRRPAPNIRPRRPTPKPKPAPKPAPKPEPAPQP